jgi:hypothetical protein
MSTAERVAWGLLSFIVLIGWLRWRGTPRSKKELINRLARRPPNLTQRRGLFFDEGFDSSP